VEAVFKEFVEKTGIPAALTILGFCFALLVILKMGMLGNARKLWSKYFD
jgi:hypothetical protein